MFIYIYNIYILCPRQFLMTLRCFRPKVTPICSLYYSLSVSCSSCCCNDFSKPDSLSGVRSALFNGFMIKKKMAHWQMTACLSGYLVDASETTVGSEPQTCCAWPSCPSVLSSQDGHNNLRLMRSWEVHPHRWILFLFTTVDALPQLSQALCFFFFLSVFKALTH